MKKQNILIVIRTAGAFALVCAAALGAGPVAPTSEAPYSRAAAKAKYKQQAIEYPADNKPTADRELLGRTLFFDPRLSGSGWISCSTCHNPGLSWGDGLPKGIGHGMKQLGRRTPTVLNTAWAELLFWDGRAGSLEEQALGPIQSAGEMNLPLDQLIAVIRRIPGYKPLFDRAYPGEAIGAPTIGRAIAAFERTVISSRAPFDKWIAGDEHAVSGAAKRGFDLFNTKAKCAECHSGWALTDNGFHDIGLADADLGRGAKLPLEAMQHAFKTPTLRDVSRRAPYMHDGSESTLDDVIEFYDRGGRAERPSLADQMKPLHLTPEEKKDLVSFLTTVNGGSRPVQVPALPVGDQSLHRPSMAKR